MTQKTYPGFTLIELAVVLAIIGTISYFGVSYMTSQTKVAAVEVTQKRQERIFYALAGYALKNNHLPCPANAATGEIDRLDGGAMRCANTIGASQGILPAKDLGLQPQDIKDGHGHYFTYAVQGAFCQASGVRARHLGYDASLHGVGDRPHDNSLCTINPADGSIEIKDSSGKVLASPASRVAVVLISHGTNGRGAYIGNGARRPVEGEHERTNIADSNMFISGEQKSDFQHRLFWVGSISLLSAYARTMCGEKIESADRLAPRGEAAPRGIGVAVAPRPADRAPDRDPFADAGEGLG